MNNRVIYRATIEGHGGLTIREVADTAYELFKASGLKGGVRFIYNDVTYEARLEWSEVKPDPGDNG